MCRLPPLPPWLQRCLPCLEPRLYQQLREVPLGDAAQRSGPLQAQAPVPTSMAATEFARRGGGSAGGGSNGFSSSSSNLALTGTLDFEAGLAGGAHDRVALERISPQNARRPLSAASLRVSQDGGGGSAGGSGSPVQRTPSSAAALLSGQRSAPQVSAGTGRAQGWRSSREAGSSHAPASLAPVFLKDVKDCARE